MARKKIWSISVTVFLLFMSLAWWLGRVLALQGWDLWLLRGGLLFLGLCAAILTFVALKRRAAPAGAAPAARDEIDLLLATSRARLKAAGVRGGIGKLPVTLVLGPAGATKTTTIVHSGMEPELLAGAVHLGEGIAPTASVNVWFAQQTIVLEAGGPVVAEPQRWARLIKHIQPSRWAAVFGRRSQAPRVAIVCFGCDELLKPGSMEAAPAAAAQLRSRLAEVSTQLGVRLPVYVLFTKADRLPYFEDFVRAFARDEAQEVLGATLPVPEPGPAGAYTEREYGRLGAAFQGIVQSLALKRLDVLPRESREEARAAAYEFPREFRKASEVATRFLLELCRPAQLGVSPFVRGFYFTGVRAIVVGDTEAPELARPGPAASAMGATSVFSAALVQQAIQQAMHSPAAGAGRRVPEWVFLKRLFRDVVLRDNVAMAVTGGGTRLDLLRRVLIGAAAVLLLVTATGMTVSFFGNRGLIRTAQSAARGVESVGAVGAAELPSADALRRLDELRAQTERIGRFQRDGRPWRLAWGLYTGGALHGELRRLYFDRFERILWGQTRGDLLAFLRGLPEAPNEASEYGTVYDALKAHLITSSHPTESTAEFLTPVLRQHWHAAADLDAERLDLATRQYDFYAAELPFGNPYALAPDEPVVVRTRAFLARFADFERFYQALTADASSSVPAIQFAQVFPGNEAVLRNDFIVPGAFTRDGWNAVQAGLNDVDRLFAREQWVVGERAVAPDDRLRLAQELRTRYVADYVRNWQQFLSAGSVAGFNGIPDAATKLARLSDNRSPLLLMLALAAQHTNVDSSVARSFQPVHVVVSPDAVDRYTTETNAGYMALLATLQATLEQAASAAGPARSQALGQASDQASQVRVEVRRIAQAFSIEGPAGAAGTQVQRLLQAPLASAESVMSGAPSAEVNSQGQAFCTPFRQLLAKYPFNAQATAEATLDEVAAMFQPGASALWSFYDDVLQELLVPRGSGFAARPGVTPQPSAAFVDAFNRAAEFSRAIFGERGTDPEVAFVLRPQATSDIPEITVTIDGQRQTFSRTVSAARTFTWQASRAREARITGSVGGTETTLLQAQGPWAVFRLFQQAEWEPAGQGRFNVRWRLPAQNLTLTAELLFEGGTPVFRRDYLGGLTCVAQVAR